MKLIWYYKCYYSFLQIQLNLEWIDLGTKSSFYFRMEGVRSCTPYTLGERSMCGDSLVATCVSSDIKMQDLWWQHA